MLRHMCYTSACILSSKPNNFEKTLMQNYLYVINSMSANRKWHLRLDHRTCKPLGYPVIDKILEVTVYQENAENLRLITFHWQSEKVETGGTCLGEQKSIQQKVVFCLLQIVLLYRGHLHKELCPGIFRYSKE